MIVFNVHASEASSSRNMLSLNFRSDSIHELAPRTLGENVYLTHIPFKVAVERNQVFQKP